METCWANWLNLGLAVTLFVAVVVLYLDGRGLRKALRTVQATLAAMQRQNTAQDVAIGQLSRAIATMDPQGTRPTTTVQRAQIPAPPAAIAATARRIEALPLPAVDTEGDRGGINPGDAIPGDDVPAPSKVEQIQRTLDGLREQGDSVPPVLVHHWERLLLRARAEAEADARSLARPATTGEPSTAIPDATGERESGEDPTRVWSGDETLPSEPSARRPRPIPVNLDAAELARLDAAAAERGISREEMAAQLARQGLEPANDRPAGPTTPPGGPANDRGTPTENERLDPRLAKRWGEKIEAARAAGHDVAHCGGAACTATPHGAAECDCNCGPCTRRAKLLADAVREVLRGR